MALLLALAAAPAQATPDFYGVKMKSEDFARNLMLVENNRVPDFSNDRPGTDKHVYAYAYVSSAIGGGRGVSLDVFNHSDDTIATDKLFRDLAIVTWDGTRYDRSETEMMWARGKLGPGEEATFNFKFPGVRIPKEEIRLIVCSFDLGETMIFLFPLKSREKIATAPQNKKSVEKTPAPFAQPAAKLLSGCVTPIKLVQSFFRSFGKEKAPVDVKTDLKEERGEFEDKTLPARYPLVQPAQVIEGVEYNFRPDFRKEVQKAQQEVERTVYQDRPWTMDDPDKYMAHLEIRPSGSVAIPPREARVLVANIDYGFVVVGAGYENGFGKNTILDVVRDGHRIAKVMITKPRDKISGAVILPEWRTREEIRVGDIVGVSS